MSQRNYDIEYVEYIILILKIKFQTLSFPVQNSSVTFQALNFADFLRYFYYSFVFIMFVSNSKVLNQHPFSVAHAYPEIGFVFFAGSECFHYLLYYMNTFFWVAVVYIAAYNSIRTMKNALFRR